MVVSLEICGINTVKSFRKRIYRMGKNVSEEKSAENGLFRMVYAVCGIAVFMTGFHVWTNVFQNDDFNDDERLLSFEELREAHPKTFYPDGWEFLQNEKYTKHRSPKEIQFPEMNREMITEDLSNLAENIEKRRVEIEKRPLPPILRLQKERQEKPRTFAGMTSEEEEEELLESPVEERTARNVSGVFSPSNTREVQRYESGKPETGSVGSTDAENEDALLSEMDAWSENLASVPGIRLPEEEWVNPFGRIKRESAQSTQFRSAPARTAVSHSLEAPALPGAENTPPTERIAAKPEISNDFTETGSPTAENGTEKPGESSDLEENSASGKFSDAEGDSDAGRNPDTKGNSDGGNEALSAVFSKNEPSTEGASINSKKETGNIQGSSKNSGVWNSPLRPQVSDPTMPYDHTEGLKILRFFNQLAENRLATYSEHIRDYSCVLYKWDTTNTSIDGGDVMYLKLREKPYSIYARFEHPKRYSGREWIFWEGHYKGRLIINSGPNAWRRTLSLEPESAGVKNCASRSVLQLGFRKLLEELISISENEEDFRSAQIRYFADAKVGERPCYALEVTFPQKNEFQKEEFYRIQIYVDRELILPIQLVIYDWPEDGKPAKIRESYTYVILKLNPGLQDKDFCHLNPEYGFQHYIPRIPEEELQFMEQFFPHTK